MSAPEVSVLVPVYNVEKYLRCCIDSILAQTFQAFELLLVDDGSTDSSGAICDEYAALDSRIRVIHKPNGGQSDARNVALDAISGRWVSMIDGDDYLEPEMLQTLHTSAVQNGAQISICGCYNCYEDRRVAQCAERRAFTCTGQEALRGMLAGTTVSGSMCDKLIHADLLAGRRFICGRIYEDALFLPDLLLSATNVAITTEPLYNYRHRSGSSTTKPFSLQWMDAIYAYTCTRDTVLRRCPELIEYADFRLMWAHFIVLDSMMRSKDYKKYPQYPSVIGYLKSHWRMAARCPLFRSSRRIAAVALKCNVRLYRLLSRANAHEKKIFT